MNNKFLWGLFHEEIVASLRNLPLEVCLVCARRVTPKTSTEDMALRGTIVDNMDVGRTEKAFASRVSEIGGQLLRRAMKLTNIKCRTADMRIFVNDSCKCKMVHVMERRGKFVS